MARYISPKELAKRYGFKIVGKLRRLPNAEWYTVDGVRKESNIWIDEAGNEYQCDIAAGECVGVIITADGGVI